MRSFSPRAPGNDAALFCSVVLIAACSDPESGPEQPPPNAGAATLGDAAGMGATLPVTAAGGSSSGANGATAGMSGTAGTRAANGGTGGTPIEGQGGDAATPASPGEPGVRFVGRVDTSDATGARFAWSGTGILARFSGTSLGVRLGGNQQYSVLIDGVLQPKLVSTGASDPIATGLAQGEHQVEIYRRTEASQGVSQFLGFDIGEGELLAPPPAPARRIEIIGDSVSTGYGDEGTLPCGFSADTENHYLTYGAIAARALDAELTTIAWSGKGIVYNYDTDVVEPMPALYGRTLPQDPGSTYDFASVPNVVVINLGTNDFSTEGDPTTELFGGEYTKLLERVRGAYPDAFILCTVGPLLSGADLSAARAGIAAGVAAFEAAGGSNVRAWEMNVANGNPPGCDYHPNLATHQAMADALIPELEAHFD